MPMKANTYLRYSECAFCVLEMSSRRGHVLIMDDDVSRLQGLNQSFPTHLIGRK